MNSIFKSKITGLLDEAFKFRWIIFGVILYVFGSRSKEQLYYFSNETKHLINQWDLINNMVGNIYLIIYVILPILLFRSLSILLEDFEYTVLIRVGSYRRWIYRTLAQLLQTFTVIAIIWGLVILIMLISVPSSVEWSSFSELNQSLSESQIMEKYIGSPVLAVLFHSFLLLQSVIVIHLFLAILYVVTKKKFIVTFTAILIWLYGAASFRLLPDSAYLFDISNYLVLHWGVTSFGNLWGPFFVGFGALFLLILIISRIDLRKPSLKIVSFNWVYIAFSSIILIVLWFETRTKTAVTIWDQFLINFFGGSQNGYNLKAFLSYFIIYFGFIFLIQLSLQKELNNTGYYKLLRFQSVNKWFWNWFKKIPIYVTLYLIILVLVSLVISVFSGLSLSHQITLNKTTSINEVVYQFFINGFLQLLFYAVFTFIIAWLSKETFYSFIATSILSIFMFPGLNNNLIIPSGLNSMSYILDDHSIYKISIVLSIWLLLGIMVTLYFLNKNDIDL
ncbi:permease [Caldifermentibacillus hisashii]|uniref:Permease n=1 Tax=Caldifermentibacillus hisashii TaxID=996558 RepID=A0ABU9JT13_9BACI|nr:permease [Caldibacillus thermoamylovorans]MCM3799403.1 permease [Caldibacillus thermoamylovorans]